MVNKSASAYERHQSILHLLDVAESVRVTDLAHRLNVSESTIRTDLETLDAQGRLRRVRGGAVPLEANGDNGYVAQKASRNYTEKSWLARWAASMVEDGDTIMLDASSTVMHMADYLADRRELTVFTNGVSVAQMLAKEPTNTVILLGGILRPNGNALTGDIGEAVLQQHHIRRAFVSCNTFVPEIGFFENDIHEAQMKTMMLRATRECVVLLDTSKIGEVGPRTFATLDDVNYVAVDSAVSSTVIDQIRRSGTVAVVCGEQTSQSYTPSVVGTRPPRIAFANLSEHTSFSRDVRRSLENAARQHGNIELILADNQLDREVALNVADELMAQSLDLVIEYQIDEDAGNLIAHRFHNIGIPVIAVDIPMVGATYFGVDNYAAGKIAGIELGQAVQRDWGGAFDYLIVVAQRRTGKLPAMRIDGQLDGMASVLGVIPLACKIVVDFDNTAQHAHAVVREMLASLPPTARVAMICFNDDAAVGALEAARETGYISRLRLVGQGADRRLRDEMRHGEAALVGATAFCPEAYGEPLLALALDILAGKQVAPAVYMDHFFVNTDNVNIYYPATQDELA